ncbi:MAG: sugar transferase [Acidobacteriota bacterium]|nr:sugar transferase [Acidobacteriota bacterium]
MTPASPSRDLWSAGTASDPAAHQDRRRAGLQNGRGMAPVDAVPATFLRLLDLNALIVALIGAYAIAPSLNDHLAPGTLLGEWLMRTGIPASSGGPQAGPELPPLARLATTLIVVAPAVISAMQAFGGYLPLLRQSRTRLLLSCAAAPIVGTGVLTLLLFTLRAGGISRGLVFLFGGMTALLFLAHRVAIRAYKVRRARSGHYVRRIAVVGEAPGVGWMRGFFASRAQSADFAEAGYFTVGAPPEGDAAIPPAMRLGTADEIGDVLIHTPIHEVIAVIGPSEATWLPGLVNVCDYFRVTLRVVPEALLRGTPRDLRLLYFADELQLPEIVLSPPHLNSDALFIKRAIDIVVSAVMLILLLPVFAMIALAIKITSPSLTVFYPWRVIGYKGKPFTGYKFTTMVADADDRKADLMDRNEMSGPVFKIKDDPRITPLGRVLRKFSLNELPQFWSVLKGDMSLVGPRPAGPHELKRYELWHKRKLSIRPGITCLWQVSGRNEISSFDDWVRLDLQYIDNWSLWLDFKILARTAWVVVRGTGS